MYSFHNLYRLKSQLTEDPAEWLEWGSWTQCTSSCGLGTEFRARQCSKPRLGGNEACSGNATESRECTLKTCQGNSHNFPHLWFSTLFSQLLTAAGKNGVSGPNVRQLAISAPKWELERAATQHLVAVQLVLGRPRKLSIAYWLTVQVAYIPTTVYLMLTYFFADTIASEWQEWSAWSQCTVSCGKGAEIRARACNKPDVGGSQSCPGNSTESRECNLDVCTGPGGIQSKDNLMPLKVQH